MQKNCIVACQCCLTSLFPSIVSFKKKYFLSLFKYSCLHFPPPLPHTPAISTSYLNPTALWLCPCVLYTCSLMTLPLFPHYLLPPLVTVGFFFISMSLILFCSLICFVDQVPLIGEIIWYLSFITSQISHSIMLSSSIHAVAKGMNSFFLLCSIPLCKYITVF